MPVSAQVTVEEALNLAARYHKTGSLLLADRTYRDILRAVPDQFDALHNLAVVCYQRGKTAEAIDLIRRACATPDGAGSADTRFWNNYAIMLAEDKNWDAALAAWDHAFALDPAFIDAMSSKAHGLWQLGRFAEAEALCRRALALAPDAFDPLLNLGNALASQKKMDEAVAAWQALAGKHPKFAGAYNNLGNAFREMGRLKESEDMCRKALVLDPKMTAAMNNLGNVLRDRGLPAEAEKLYRQAVSLKPDYAEAQNNLGVALLDQHKFEEAATALRYAIAFNAGYADAHGNLSHALLELGEIEDAQFHAQKAVLLKPDSARAYADLCDVLFTADRIDEARAALDEAMKLTPDSPHFYLKLAAILDRAGRFDEALEAVDKAVALNPEMPEAYVRKGLIYFLDNRLDAALAALCKAIELKPDHAMAYATMAEVYQSLGDLEESAKHARKAIALQAGAPSFYYTLGKTKKYAKGDPDIAAMEAMLEGMERKGTQFAISLYFALFKACEDTGDYERAFEYLKKGNDLKRKTVPYDEETQREIYENFKQVFSAQAIRAYEGQGCQSDVPVFIVGMPRSGTTLTEQIISAHPDVYGAGELNELGAAERAVEGNLSPTSAAAFGREYVERIRKLDPTGKALRITDKMPGNYFRIGLIACILPQAKIIHCRRDPVDTCLSCYKQLFSRGQYWSYDLEELAGQYNLYRDLMEHWRRVLPRRFIEIDYEDTVGDLETQARRLIDYIGLPWNDACLAPHENRRAILTASKTQVIRPVYKTSVQAWKRYESKLEPLIEKLRDHA